MDYEIPSLNYYLSTVSDRIEEDSSNVQSFCLVLEALIFGGEFQLNWDIDPTISAVEAAQWSFDIIPPDSPDEMVRFFVGITDDDTAERLRSDPYYVDISTWIDDLTLDDLGLEYTFKNEEHDGELYDIRIVETHIGLYSDPCRPSTWIITPTGLGENSDSTTVQEVTLEILEKWKKFLVGNPEKIEKIKPTKNNKKNPFKIVSIDGKLV